MATARHFGNVNELFALGDERRARRRRRPRRARARGAGRARAGSARRRFAPGDRDHGARARGADRARRRPARRSGRGRSRAAAEREAQLPAPLGLPAPIKPAPELLGEMLVDAGRPAEAIAVLRSRRSRRNPNRSLSVLGLARAAAAAGDAGAARRHYTALLANFDEADADLPLLREARAATRSERRGAGVAAAARSAHAFARTRG